jgi:hypothetical protein
MTDSGTGIQELMAAETRASQIVAEARIGEFNQEKRSTSDFNEEGRSLTRIESFDRRICIAAAFRRYPVENPT